ncbi:putative aldehyde dehydrogenase DhaS [Cyphellophora attinorum]|uniref:aldehyde dehydrogenase (NAD(+)) n=1 Tax=Cyphellophora attinorum TaxID=1664694 RepID=A0A0N0NL92_9EURO|nr:putative aldehyde dehydrogenase DhaS [Phialophora attinorum]KPI38769.1 putative aldehyde dehydrogenase DhaS [Phialophora attinorum]
MSPSKVVTIDFNSFHNIINGELRSSKQKYHGVDPATGEPNWDVPVATEQDVDEAVVAATKAFNEWKKTTWAERQQRIVRFQEAIESYSSELAELLMKECGKPRMFAAAEAGSIAKFADWHANLPEPDATPIDLEDRTVVNKYQPLGVAAAICPWNFPLSLASLKIFPAVLMGCAVIVKPSPFTPYSALKLVEIAQQVFPPGSFTGSIATGKKIAASAAKTVKRVTLEMGGNDPAIVLPDADIAKLAPRVAMGAFFNTAQVCVASKRIYVHSSIYEEFLAAFIDATKTLKVGASNEEGVMLGPIQNEMQYNKVKTYYADTKSKGYKVAYGSLDVQDGKGFFINPAIIDNPPDDALVVTEEPFGPIVPVQSYDDIDEVIRRANDTKVGLGATVWGSDPKTLQSVADRIETGTVWINSFPSPAASGQFGGVKESGLGTELGTLGILAYANVKCIHTFKA